VKVNRQLPVLQLEGGIVMKFWESMNDKYGFEDGSAYPDGVETYRDVYCKSVNKLAEQKGSDFRVVPFDRAGTHNYCLWMTVPKDWFEKVYLPKQEADKQWIGCDWGDIPDNDKPEPQPDEALNEAIAAAMDMDLDGFVEVEVKVSKDFAGFLNGM
jgi:hypothetical protein